MTRRIALAAGGTGGHLFPAQALAETLLVRGWAVTLLTDARGLRYAEGMPAEIEIREIPAASPAQGGLTAKLALPVRILRGIALSWAALRGRGTAALVGFGGYPSFPPLAAAWALGLPVVLHEQNAVLGAVNRRFARRAKAVACGTWPLQSPPEGAHLVDVGNPLRARVLAAAAPYPEADGPLSLLVFGGSQGASVFARLAPAAVEALPEDLRARLSVVQQVRPGEEAEVAEAYAAAGVRAELAPFFADLPERMAAAHLVLARAGASTVAEIAAIGRPAVLVPFPSAAGDHQTANARALAEAGAAVLAPEGELTAEGLAAHLAPLLRDPAAARQMAEAARARARPDAAERLADLVEAAVA